MPRTPDRCSLRTRRRSPRGRGTWSPALSPPRNTLTARFSASTSGESRGFLPPTCVITTLARWWIVPISIPGRSPLLSRNSSAASRLKVTNAISLVDWLQQHFEAVTMGNHDRFVLSWLQANPRPSPSAQAEWLTDVPRREFPRWRAVLAGMPIALTIQTPHGAVGVVHADPFCTQVEPVQEEGEGCRRVGLCVLAFPFGMSSYGLDSNRSSVLNAW